MALSEEQIIDLFNEACRETFSGLERFRHFARAIEAAVRKQDEALIQQLVEALDEATTYTASAMWSPSMTNECKELIAAGRARLEGKP